MEDDLVAKAIGSLLIGAVGALLFVRLLDGIFVLFNKIRKYGNKDNISRRD